MSSRLQVPMSEHLRDRKTGILKLESEAMLKVVMLAGQEYRDSSVELPGQKLPGPHVAHVLYCL